MRLRNESLKRDKQVSLINGLQPLKLNKGIFAFVNNKSLKVGDFIKVKNMDIVPADIILVASSKYEGSAVV